MNSMTMEPNSSDTKVTLRAAHRDSDKVGMIIMQIPCSSPTPCKANLYLQILFLFTSEIFDDRVHVLPFNLAAKE